MQLIATWTAQTDDVKDELGDTIKDDMEVETEHNDQYEEYVKQVELKQ